jgi:acetoin utilization deacetylase AcuC-like enzyme
MSLARVLKCTARCNSAVVQQSSRPATPRPAGPETRRAVCHCLAPPGDTHVKLVYSPRYALDIGPHVFLTEKYRRVHERLTTEPHPSLSGIVGPDAATWDQLALVHSDDYLHKIRTRTLSSEELVQLELPLTDEVVDGFRLMTGGTLTAARLALVDGLCAHVGGGFHHAFASHGEGFCLFNDVVVAAQVLKVERAVSRVAVIDLDVHHGNGTALICGQDPSVFTFSMHDQHNYPVYKPRGSLDVGLPPGTGDQAYLEQLSQALPLVLADRPEVIFYLAGADPYEDDQLGHTKLSKHGLQERDRLVLSAARDAAVPTVVVLAGGYARELTDTVDIHTATLVTALDISVAPTGPTPSSDRRW